METLKDKLARLALERASTKEVSTNEKIAPSETPQGAIKNQIDTNIRAETENKPQASKIGLLGILLAKKAINQQNLPISPASTLAPSTSLSAEETNAITSTKSNLSLAYRLAMAKEAKANLEAVKEEGVKLVPSEQTTELLKKELNVSTVEEAKTFLENKESNVKVNVAMSILDRLKAKKLTPIVEGNQAEITKDTKDTKDKEESKTERKNETFSLDITLNEKQLAAVGFAKSKKDFVLLGAAGTGKTSSEGAILHEILTHDDIKQCSYKGLSGGRVTAPSVVVCAYTRRASANSAKAILKDPILREKLNHNIMTIHALLEFVPEVYFDVVSQTEKFRFAPTRHRNNPLTITHLLIEEATLVGMDLWEMLYDALPYDVQLIFVGDINQLPPVFGPSILNYALTKLPVVELTQVYRQAEGSPIISNAHKILKGEMIESAQNEQGLLKVITGTKLVKVGQARTLASMTTMFKQFYEMNIYNPEEDIILSPWNKQELGTDSLNTMISELLSVKYNKLVYEVIAGFNKIYLAEGDKVICNKRDAIIVSIERNPAYVGKEPQLAGTDLSRMGFRRIGQHNKLDLDSEAHEDEVGDYKDFSVETLEETAMDRKMQSSHKVMIAYEDGYTDTLTAAGDLAPSVFALGYAMTVHKSQGSEWRRVFIMFHPDHAISLSREMLYTAITRAREEVYLIAKQYVLDKAVISQRVKGNTLEDKIAIFNSGVKEMQVSTVRVSKRSIQNKYVS